MKKSYNGFSTGEGRATAADSYCEAGVSLGPRGGNRIESWWKHAGKKKRRTRLTRCCISGGVVPSEQRG